MKKANSFLRNLSGWRSAAARPASLYLSRLPASRFFSFPAEAFKAVLAAALLGLAGCASAPKTPSLDSENLVFKILWSFSSAQTQGSFSSLVFIRGSDQLRLDVLQPLMGSPGGFVLNKEEMTLYALLEKIYYRGRFNSKIFFPELPAFSGRQLIALLRGKALKNRLCQRRGGKLAACSTSWGEISWEYKGPRLSAVYIKGLKRGRLEARIKSLKSKAIPAALFRPPVKKFKRSRNPLFFQKLY